MKGKVCFALDLIRSEEQRCDRWVSKKRIKTIRTIGLLGQSSLSVTILMLLSVLRS